VGKARPAWGKPDQRGDIETLLKKKALQKLWANEYSHTYLTKNHIYLMQHNILTTIIKNTG
jgi:hypothetical protein